MSLSPLKNFKAIGLFKAGGLSNLRIFEHNLIPFKPKDLLVKIKSVALNPIDAKKRMLGRDNLSEQQPLILGYDASGIVQEIGPEVKCFKKGDEVYYAGDITRNGSNSQYQLIDERIVGLKPQNLNFSEAAALPLVTITAWESLIENMKIPKNPVVNKDKTLLIISGAGGVGSIAIQIAKVVLGLNVIATSSRKETMEFCKSLGADHVINYKGSLKNNLEAIGVTGVDYVFNCSEMTVDYFNQIADICKFGASVGWITGLREPVMLNLVNYFVKRISLHPEFMFARSMYNWEMEKQKGILDDLRDLVEKNLIKTNMKVLKKFNLETLKEGHIGVESGKNIGKYVLEDVDKYFEELK